MTILMEQGQECYLKHVENYGSYGLINKALGFHSLIVPYPCLSQVMFFNQAWASVLAVAFAVALGSAGSAHASESGEQKWSNPGKDLKKIKHIVLFMQENRAFDHYFGTMHGVRGFQDPNVMVSNNTGQSVFHQPVDKTILSPAPPKDVHELQPFYLNWKGGDWKEKTQCMLAGVNDWVFNHAAWNNGENDHWALRNSVYSLGYFKEDEIPVQWNLADSFTVGDMYYESIIASTDPNRVAFFASTINPQHGSTVEGSNKHMGGPVLNNHASDGCQLAANGGPLSCMPLRWKTIPEYLQDAGISWQVYQDEDNFGDDPLAFFTQYKESSKHKGELAKRGTSYVGLKKFYEDARDGNLPEVSYIVAPENLSEHPPFMPKDGAWIQRKVAEAVMNGKDWDSTALIYSYDETGGWADHVMSPHPPRSEKGEWMVDPFLNFKGIQPIGPGYRLPFYIVSPWTRGGHVFTEHAAHESQTMFLEKWAEAHGKGFQSKEIPTWRRQQLSDLVNAFDFSKEDTSVPYIPRVRKPSQDHLTHRFNGGIKCLISHAGLVFPPVPYGKQDSSNSMQVNKGYKSVRGDLTEGRKLAFEANGRALSHANGKLGTSATKKNHDGGDQLFILHWLGSAPKDNRFHIATEKGDYITKKLSLSDNKNDAGVFSIRDVGNGAGYNVTELNAGKQVTISKDGSPEFGDSSFLKIYSVTR